MNMKIVLIVLFLFIVFFIAQITGNVIRHQVILENLINTSYYKMFTNQFDIMLEYIGECDVLFLKEKLNWENATYWCVVFSNKNKTNYLEFVVKDNGKLMYQHIGSKRFLVDVMK